MPRFTFSFQEYGGKREKERKEKMPLIKEQEMKALSTIKLQPDKMNSKINIMIMMDIGGARGKEISEAIGLCESRVSIIRNSPMYIEQRDKRWRELQEQFVDKKSDRLVDGDPVQVEIKDACLEAARTKVDLMRNAQSEFVRNNAADGILDRGGYKVRSEKTKVSIEVTEKMAGRFEKVLLMEKEDELGSNARATKIEVKEELS